MIANYSFQRYMKKWAVFNKWVSFIKVVRLQNQLIILKLYGRHSIFTFVHLHQSWIVKPQYHINSLDISIHIPLSFSQWQSGELCSLCRTNNFISRTSIWFEFEKAINYPCFFTRRLTGVSFTRDSNYRGSHGTIHVNLTKVTSIFALSHRGSDNSPLMIVFSAYYVDQWNRDFYATEGISETFTFWLIRVHAWGDTKT